MEKGQGSEEEMASKKVVKQESVKEVIIGDNNLTSDAKFKPVKAFRVRKMGFHHLVLFEVTADADCQRRSSSSRPTTYNRKSNPRGQVINGSSWNVGGDLRGDDVTNNRRAEGFDNFHLECTTSKKDTYGHINKMYYTAVTTRKSASNRVRKIEREGREEVENEQGTHSRHQILPILWSLEHAETAHEKNQKYKEGKSVLERLVSGPDGTNYWVSHEAHIARSEEEQV
ncbi:yippee-like protein [Artemisia annua]|uniref:Yippee-like protein n=1 Tax=Artemisia annua TaxID=35608 RepID=A0A2U1QCJ7_ARTAN|nr:yippee-like protein [Artemisia annua]